MSEWLLHRVIRSVFEPGAKRSKGGMNGVKVYLLLETGGGGSGRHVLDLYSGLVATGWDAHLLLSTTRMDAAFAKEVAALPQHHITYLKLRRSPHITDLQVMRCIRRELRQERGAVILHAHSTKAGMVAWALRGRGTCRIFTPHAYPCMDPGRTGRQVPLIRCVEKLFSRPFDSIIAVSEDERRYTASLGVKPMRIHHIPNGVDAASVHHQAAAGRVQRHGKGPVLGFLGRLVEQKNPLLFVRALAEMVQRGHDATALIVGDGPLREPMLVLARSLNVDSRIRWLGLAPGLAQLGNMDVMLHTSISESLPYSLLEAVAAELPVVAVCNPGSRTVFEELLPQVLVPCGTARGLADVVIEMLQNGPLRQLCRERYAMISEQFSTRDMVRKTIAVYENALRAKTAQKSAFDRHIARAFPKVHLPGLGTLLRHTINDHVSEDLLPSSRGN